MHKTRHAQIRMEQRGINDIMLNLILEIGETHPTRKGKSTMIGKKHIALLKRKKEALTRELLKLQEECKALERLRTSSQQMQI